MCGISVVVGKADMTKEQKLRNYADLRTLLLYNRDRGKDATGIFGVGTTMVKDSVDAYEFFKKYHKELKEVPSHIMIGHTRNSSVNHVKIKANAHPIQTGGITLVHNGTVTNWQDLRSLYELNTFDVDMDSKMLAFALEKTQNFEVLEKYDGSANLVWYHEKFPDTVYVYKGSDKENKSLFYGRKEGCLFISSLKDSLITIDIPEENIFLFHDEHVSKVIGDEIAGCWKIKRNPLKSKSTNSYHSYDGDYGAYGGYYDNAHVGECYKEGKWWKIKDWEEFDKTRTSFLSNTKTIINYEKLEPTVKTYNSHYEHDPIIGKYVRKDLYDRFHNVAYGNQNVKIKISGKNATYKDDKGKKQRYTGSANLEYTVSKIKYTQWYLNGHECSQKAWEDAYNKALDVADTKWLEQHVEGITSSEKDQIDKGIQQLKNDVNNSNSIVPRINDKGIYCINGHPYTGEYRGLLEGKDIEEIRKEVARLEEDITGQVKAGDSAADVELNKKALESAKQWLEYYEKRTKKHTEDPAMIGKFFFKGVIVTKDEYDKKQNPKQMRIIEQPVETGEIDDDSLVDEEMAKQIAETEQEAVDLFTESAYSLQTMEKMFKDIDTSVIKELKIMGKAVGDVLMDIIKNNILERNNILNNKFKTPDVIALEGVV